MKEFVNYIKSKLFLRTLIYAASIAFTMLMFLLLYLRLYTHHNRSVVVPDFADLPIDVAASLIESRHLRYEIFDSIYIVDRDRGVVIDQHPKPGLQVKKDRKIYLTINANSPEKMIMPDLVGITLREARTKISVAGLRLGKLGYRYSIAKNVVLEQQADGNIVQPGDTILKGSAIDLILGKGLSDEKSMVPDLFGLTMEEAIDKATNAFFTVNTSIPDETIEVNEESVPVIFRQHPAHRENILVPLGTQITVWITTDSTKLSLTDEQDPNDHTKQDLNEVDNAEIIEDDSYDYDYTD